MNAAGIDLDRLARLLTGAGITPKRLERAVCEVFGEGVPAHFATLNEVELSLLYLALGDGLAEMRQEHDAVLRSVGLTISAFRTEANSFQQIGIRQHRIIKVLLSALLIINIIAVCVVTFVFASIPSSRLPGSVVGFLERIGVTADGACETARKNTPIRIQNPP